MPNVYNGIFKDAQKYIKSNSQYSPFVYKDTPQEQNKFPLVIIKQKLLLLRSMIVNTNLLV